jgi:type IV pilus assembly protein PilY1
VQALLRIFNEVAAVNTAFASSSLPVAANAQGTFLNQIFMGQFRPDGGGGPRWAGNLKQYQFAVTGSPPNEQLFLADANGDAAISGAGTGFISAVAESFWTEKNPLTLPDSIGGFWLNNPTGAGDGFDLPDGEIVDKGGAAQQIRLANLQNNYSTNPHSPRNLFTCTTGCAKDSSLSGFHFATDNSSITDTSLGITAPTNSVSSLSRSGATVTVGLSAAPSPLLVDGQTVAMAGAAYPELNGTFSITKVNETTFTYTINESPKQTTTSTGTYTASLPSSPKTITQLTRTGTGSGTAQSLVRATVTGHGYANNQNITISGAGGAQYNGTFPITLVDANTFTYVITDAPATPGSGGTATQGANSLPISTITRGATAADGSSTVMVTFGSKLPTGFNGTTTVTIAGVVPSAYNGTYTIIAGNNSGLCNGSKPSNKEFCYSIATLPASPDTTSGMTADTTATSTVTLTHPVTCTGSTPSPTATVTATGANSFANGNSISIAGNPVGANENRYVGTYTIANRTPTTFTYSITVSPPLCTFSTAGVTAATTTGGADKNSLINWVRGEDNVHDEQSPGNGINIRSSVHGDVLHSRPTVINYGPGTGVVVFYGANDGTFRAVNGNQPLGNGNPIGGADPGGEIFSFIPTEFYKKLKRLYQNSPQVKLANTPTGIVPTPMPREYFFDGSTGVYQGGGKVYLYLAGRRGTDENGNGVIYALDVSDPADPKFLWKHIGGEAGFEQLGQAWSTPKVAFVKGHVDGSGNPLPVVIFGGGYDTNQDSDPPGVATDSVGRAIYVLDALDGTVVWKAVFAAAGGATSCTGNPCNLSGMTYSIPSDITLLNRDYDLNPGYIDRLYAADVGGNIWRVDLEPTTGTAPSNWIVTKFASLGGSGSPKRKFFFPPDVVTTKNFDMVMAGTGDREHPLYSASTTSSYAVKNRFYALRDPNVGTEVAPGWVAITDGTASTGTAVPSDLTHVIPPSTLYDAATATDRGFYVDMPNAGEKIVNAPTTVGGFSYFGTNAPPLPTSQACTNLGTARGYQVNFLTGATRSNVIDGGGLPPSPVAGLVTIDMGGGTEKTFPFLLGANPDPTCQGPDCTSSFGGSRPPVPIPPTRRRVFWYNDKHDN